MTCKTYLICNDIHYPVHDRPSIAAVLDFARKNDIHGFIFNGDQLDLAEVSHHTKGKSIHRPKGALKANLDGFVREILEPLDKALGPKCERVWIHGNHERFILQDMLEEQPELEGMLSLDEALGLKRRGYKVVGLGGHTRIGHLYVLHGDTVGGGANPAKKAVDTWCQSVVIGHHHTLQSFTKASPAHEGKRWTGTVLPCLSTTNPGYARGRANTHLHGFGIVELMPGGNFNLFPVVINDGKFAYGGKVYGCSRRTR